MSVVGALDVTNRDRVTGAMQQLNGVAGTHVARSLDGEIGTRSRRLAEPVDGGGVAHPDAELEARDARLGHANRDAADLPALPDHRRPKVDPGEREVVAEGPRTHW